MISLTAEVFHFPSNDQCADSYIEVSEGGETKGKFCGNDPPSNFLSETNAVNILYYSDTIEESAFKYNYRSGNNYYIYFIAIFIK